jgi:hypothetical protein
MSTQCGGDKFFAAGFDFRMAGGVKKKFGG